MIFWILAGLLTIAATFIVVFPILKRRQDVMPGAASDIAVYRDQLKELDADVARSLLSAEEAEASRLEISRRLLAVDDRMSDDTRPAPTQSTKLAVPFLLAVMSAGALGIYAYLGNPGAPDQPLAARTGADRPAQAEVEAQFAEAGSQPPRVLEGREKELLDKLRAALESRPDDLTGHQLLAQTLNSIGDYAAAWAAQDEVIRILGNAATTDEHAIKAEMMVFAAGGYVSPEADDALARALQLDATNQRARYYSGISMAQRGRPELAMQLWSGLLSEGPADAPWKAPIREQVRDLANNTGLPLPEGMLGGPTQEDVDAASDMSAQERQDMIRGMVNGLSDRLASVGGTPSEWARLIGALGVLNETDRAQAIYDEAKQTFAGDVEALDLLSQAATGAGLRL